MKNKLVFLFLCALSLQVFASHIVGGNITYQYLGSNKYKIQFKIYRDCEKDANGNSKNAPFDGDSSRIGQQGASPFNVSIINMTTGSTANSSLYFKSVVQVQLDPLYNNPCIDTTLACVEEALYEMEYTVPDPSKSYAIMHSRCCRNAGILNMDDISNPNGGTTKPGMGIYAVIPPTSSYSNNSAVFKKFPPVFVCMNKQFYFDHSATDVDGDGLRYYLTNPIHGGTSANPIVTTNTLSGMTNYIGIKSPYTLSNLIGGSPVLTLDSITGLLSCKPNTVGRYVVSIMVKEFRGGIAIDSAIRDFQFNVVDCDIPTTDVPFEPGTLDLTTGIADYTTNCKNKTIDFKINSTNADNILWDFGVASRTDDISTAQNASYTYLDSGVYMVKLISYRLNSRGVICNDTIRRRVRVYPNFNADFSYTTSSTYCAGSTIQFTDKSTGTYGGANTWSWDFNQGNYASIKNPTTVYNLAGTYQVKLSATNIKGCKADTTIPVTIFPNPIINTSVQSLCIGQSSNLVCNVSVAAPSTIAGYRWTLPDGSQVATCSTTYKPTSSGSGIVQLWAITDKGCKDSQNISYTVYPLPMVDAGNDLTICYNKTAQLQATGAVSYSWTPSATLNNPNISNPIASPLYPNSTLYTVKGTDANGCYNTDSVRVSFYSKSFISAGLDTSVCLNKSQFRDSVRLDGQGSFASVYWTPVTALSDANILNPMSKPQVNTEYILHAMDNKGCLVEDTVMVYVLDPKIDLLKTKDTSKCSYDTIRIFPADQGVVTSYLWTPSGDLSSGTVQAPLFYTKTTTLYILTVSNYCYSGKKDSILVHVPPIPTSGIPVLDSICSGDVYQFSLNPAHTYQWTTQDTTLSSYSISNPTCSPTVTSDYYITITDTIGCKNKESMKLIVNYPPIIGLYGNNAYLCKGDTLKLTVVTNLKSKLLWWNSNILSSDTASTVYAFPTKSTTFYIKASTAINCYNIDTFHINVEQPILPYVKSIVRMCRGEYINLYAEGGLYYRWSPPYHIYDTLSATPQVFPDSTCRYFVHISNHCFSDSSTVYVIVDSLPKITLPSDTQIYRGQTIDLEAKYIADSVEWSPKDDISYPFVSRITVHPENTTTYSVSVLDGNKCIGIDTIRVEVIGKDVLLIPTAFTPNGDGINDYFGVVKSLNVRELEHFDVYNRWGERVFQTHNIDDKWDGRYKGELCPTGIYIYSIELTNADNQKIKKSGNIELIR